MPLLRTPTIERNGEVSPDGRWLAYESDESGRSEVYVRPFPAVASGRWQVSTGGGTRPFWAHDGRELFFNGGADGALTRVGVEGGSTFTATAPTKLLEPRYYTGGSGRTARMGDVSADGRRFLMLKSASEGASTSLVVVLNWTEELKRLIKR